MRLSDAPDGAHINPGSDQEPTDMATIPENYLDLFKDKKAFASLATLMPDGTPQVTPVWLG